MTWGYNKLKYGKQFWERKVSRIKLREIISAVRGDLLTGEDVDNCYIETIYAGDRISDLIVSASKNTLIITHIANISLCQLLELFDIPAICLVSKDYPTQDVVEKVKSKGGILIKSRYDMFETCGKIYRLLENSESI